MDFTIRPWTERDAFSIKRHADDIAIWRNLRDAFPHPYELADAFGYIAACSSEAGTCARAIEVAGEAVGSIGIFFQKDVHRYTAELGYWLGQEYWGRGIMSAAVTRFCEECFSSFELHRIFAEPYAHNLTSRRVLEKAGFHLEGTLRKAAFKEGQIVDCCMYAKLNSRLLA